MSTPYPVPSHLQGTFSQEEYKDWLDQKARPHQERDNARWGTQYTKENYRKAIHDAIVRSDGNDPYTGEPLDWGQAGKYDNLESENGGAVYKKSLRNLPTVDHVDTKSKKLDFEIVSWFINDAKSDLSPDEFIELCRKIVDHADSKKHGSSGMGGSG